MKPFLLHASLIAFLMLPDARALTLDVRAAGRLSSAERRKLESAVSLAEAVVASKEFEQRVRAFEYEGESRFAQSRGLTNEQLYRVLQEGAEQDPEPTAPDGRAELEVRLEAPRRGPDAGLALAFTTPEDHDVHLFRDYFAQATLPELCATLLHEWTHKMGFDHDFEPTPRRPFTVPYGIGRIVRELAEARLAGPPKAR